MRRRRLLIITSWVMAIYGIAILIGFVLSKELPDLYGVYKDLAILIVALPAAYLAFCFQRRTEYMQALRNLWIHMIDAVQEGFRYTHTANPSRELYTETLVKLSAVIEEERGVFKNVDERKGRGGLYPFEPLKEIYEEIYKLGFGEKATDQLRKEVREKINKHWKDLRSRFLLEFDRDFPTYPKSKYLVEAENRSDHK